MGIVLAILLFGLIIVIHELGHFLLAKANGIEVFEFAIGMGPTLFSRRIGGTLYSIHIFPLGGYCMMGEDEEILKQDEGQVDESLEGKEVELCEASGVHKEKEPVQIGNFNEKSVWARMSVILAGPMFNFILAWIFATIMIVWTGYGNTEIGAVSEGSAAQEAGMEAGDEITAMGGRNIYLWSEISIYNFFHAGQEIEVEYERDGEKYEVSVTPRYDEESGGYLLGVSSTSYVKGNLLESMEYGVYTVRYWILSVVDSIRLLLSGGVGMNDLSGPVGVVSIVDETYQVSASYGWTVVVYNLMSLVVLLSANIGVMNLLPIPALDGGRLLLLIIEAIRGKRIAPEKEGKIHFIGFVILMGLMAVVLVNDILKLF